MNTEQMTLYYRSIVIYFIIEILYLFVPSAMLQTIVKHHFYHGNMQLTHKTQV